MLFLGAGEAATGIADLTVAAMAAKGVDPAEARRKIWLVDSKGLVVKSRKDLPAQKQPYAHDHAPVGDFLSAVKALKPTGIIGVAAVGGTFTQEVLRAMTDCNVRPIVFALSNPTSKAECTAEQAYQWTDGRALFACGSPFAPVPVGGKTLVPRQGNNSYIFPGVGLGAIACGATRITEEMFLAAANTLAAQVTPADLDQGSLYPPLANIRAVSARIAVAVAEVAYQRGLAAKPRPANLLRVRREPDVRSTLFAACLSAAGAAARRPDCREHRHPRIPRRPRFFARAPEAASAGRDDRRCSGHAMSAAAAMPPLWLLQAAVAAVWLYEGLWCKVLARSPHQFEVVEQVPLLAPRTAHTLLRLLGVVETALGFWVLSGWQPIAAAAVQTALLIGLNSAGIYFSRQRIPDPAGMVLKNAALLVLAWVAASVAAAGGA